MPMATATNRNKGKTYEKTSTKQWHTRNSLRRSAEATNSSTTYKSKRQKQGLADSVNGIEIYPKKKKAKEHVIDVAKSTPKTDVNGKFDLENEQPPKTRQQWQTLRVGWLHTEPDSRRYRRMPRPLGGVKRLKLDESRAYSVSEIRRMALAEFGGNLELRFEVRLGHFDGHPLTEFHLPDGASCDIWSYCDARRTSLYQLNLFMLTKNRYPAVRVLYRLLRVSKYTGETSHTECEKPELHAQLAEATPLEEFEPSEFGHELSSIELAGEALLRVWLLEGGARRYEFPARSPEGHGVVWDTDELRGVAAGELGVGFVTGCTDACRPRFTWYRDDEVYKTGSSLYWISVEGGPHRWRCTVACQTTGAELHSKEFVTGEV